MCILKATDVTTRLTPLQFFGYTKRAAACLPTVDPKNGICVRFIPVLPWFRVNGRKIMKNLGFHPGAGYYEGLRESAF